jgi:predicted DNA-binding antitoxin AbrB/MazE fold protein
MTTPIEAIYEQGVLRPVKPIQLPEGMRVEIILLTPDQVSTGKTTAEMLAEIAALPEEGSSDPFSGRDHDAILYGEKP